MNQPRLAYLFQAYFNKTATPAERDELMALLEQPENDEQVKDLLTHTWEQHTSESQPFRDSQGEKMLTAILQEGRSRKPVPVIGSKPASRWWRVAAAAAILLFIAAGGYFWFANKPSTPTLTQTTQPVRDTIMPGGNKAVLTLADGSRIVLDSTREGTLTKQGNVKVINLNTAVLAYNAGSGNAQEVIYNTLSTPPGGQYQLLLADGTKVWLNASSSIHFPVAFKGAARNVAITGEAYFEVAKNAAMPFTVTVKDATVQVLGTHFNIMAYDDERSINTTLLEGSVKVSKGSQQKMLAPGQQSKMLPTGAIKVSAADIEEVMAWKNGWFQFNASDIEKIMRQVSRWYDVDVVYDGKIPTGHFTGIVSRQNNISQVLQIMQAGGVRFTISGKKVTVHNRI
jgi:ferric-dicitrate binding protein FerR (iron transport regulator)